MSDFDDLREFGYADSTVQLWIFKKSITDAKFRAWHVITDEEIERIMRVAALDEMKRITEHAAYTHLSQNNESSCLSLTVEDGKNFSRLKALVDRPELENKIRSEKDLKGAKGYVVKFQGSNTIYAVRRAAPSWRPIHRKTFINAIFQNGELSALPEESFTFDSRFDFYCINDSIFIVSKSSYESLMSDKSVYKKSFEDLLKSPEFSSLFTDLGPIKDYVGTNPIQLRRMVTIRERSIYMQENFLPRLQSVSDSRGWDLNFHSTGKILACTSTAKTIIQILLDHRLLSEITENLYDVPDAKQI